GPVDHAERRVASLGQLGRGLDGPLEQRVQGELRGERDARVDERAKSVAGRGRVVGLAWAVHRVPVLAPIVRWISPQPCGFSLLPLRETAIAAERVLPLRRAGIAGTGAP